MPRGCVLLIIYYIAFSFFGLFDRCGREMVCVLLSLHVSTFSHFDSHMGLSPQSRLIWVLYLRKYQQLYYRSRITVFNVSSLCDYLYTQHLRTNLFPHVVLFSFQGIAFGIETFWPIFIWFGFSVIPETMLRFQTYIIKFRAVCYMARAVRLFPFLHMFSPILL